MTGLPRRRAESWIVACALLATGVRLWFLLATGHWTGAFEYDDGVYFGAAWALAHGVLPYRNFVFVQPPGILILLLPIATLGRAIGEYHALILARGVTTLLSGIDVALAGWLVRRLGWTAIAIVCIGMFAYPANTLSSSSILLEPLLIFWCLLAFNILYRGGQLTAGPRRWFVAGVALTMALDVKLWAAVPILVICVLAVRRRRYSALAALIGGSLGGAAIFVAPFLLAAPVPMFQQVVLAQAHRVADHRLPIIYRLEFLAGWLNYEPTNNTFMVFAAVLVLSLWLTLLAVRLKHARLRPLGDLELASVTCTVVISLMFMLPGDYYYHYAAFFAPFAFLSAGLMSRAELGADFPTVTRDGLLVAALLGCAYASALYAPVPQVYGIAKAALGRGCLVSVSPEILVAAGELRFVHGCPVVIDTYGEVLFEQSRGLSSAYIDAWWTRDLERAHCAVVVAPGAPRVLESFVVRQALRLQKFKPVARHPEFECRA